MSTDLQFHRRSIRLKNYDYSSFGYYFVTICSHNRDRIFGEIENNEMIQNHFGLIIKNEWLKSENIRNEISLDTFVVMPNHFHGIFMITNTDVGANGRSPLQTNKFRMKPKSVSSFMAGFKSSVTNTINEIRKTPKQPIWQGNYWEHVVRDDDDLKRIRRYIDENPQNWFRDRNNPEGLFM